MWYLLACMRHINLIREYHTISATGPQSGAPEERGQGAAATFSLFHGGQCGQRGDSFQVSCNVCSIIGQTIVTVVMNNHYGHWIDALHLISPNELSIATSSLNRKCRILRHKLNDVRFLCRHTCLFWRERFFLTSYRKMFCLF